MTELDLAVLEAECVVKQGMILAEMKEAMDSFRPGSERPGSPWGDFFWAFVMIPQELKSIASAVNGLDLPDRSTMENIEEHLGHIAGSMDRAATAFDRAAIALEKMADPPDRGGNGHRPKARASPGEGVARIREADREVRRAKRGAG